MEIKALSLALLLLFTLLTKHRPVNCQVFCRSQISLANEACSLRSFPGMRPSVPLELNETSMPTAAAADSAAGPGASGAYELARSRDDDDDEEEEEGEEEDQGEGSSGRRHRRRHRHNAEGSADPYDTACCRRVMAIDNSCVCQAVSRLPVFMTAVRHVIKLRPVDGCDVSFECPGTSSPLG